MTNLFGEKRRLSKRQAQRCEDAAGDLCYCRCKGKLHGAQRGNVADLKLGDPHSLKTKCYLCNGTGKRAYIGIVQMTLVCSKCKGTGILKPKGAKK